MSIVQVDDIFSWEQIRLIHDAISKQEIQIDSGLGRAFIGNIKDSLDQKIIDKFYEIAKNISDAPLKIDHIFCAEYSEKYGKPNLPPHFDGDSNDLIINMQLSSNTSWHIGLNLDTYSLKDNSALIFNGNTEIHWRTHKKFERGEYVRLLFVRFYNSENRSDHSHLSKHWPSHDIFKEIRELRDSLV